MSQWRITTSVLLTVFCFSTLSVGAVKAQENIGKATPKTKTAPSKTDSDESRTIQEKRALLLLDALFDKTKDFTDEATKVRTQLQIADAFWDYDKPKARKEFEDAFLEVTSFVDKSKISKSDSKSPTQKGFDSRPLIGINLYNAVLTAISRRDSKLAKKLIDSLIDIPADKESSFDQFSELSGGQRSLLNLQLANSFVDSDPQEAVRLARASEARTINSTMTGLLISLKHRDVAAANDLFNYALSIAQKDLPNLAANVDQLAYYVLPGYGEPAVRFNMGMNDAEATINQADPELIRVLLSFAYKSLAAREASSTQPSPESVAREYSVWQGLGPYYDQYLPEGSAIVRAHLSLTIQQIPPGPQRDFLVNGSSANGGEDLVSKTDSTDDPRMKDSLYSRAMLQAANKGDFDKAILLAEKIKNDKLRQGNLATARQLAAEAAIKKGDFDVAIRYADPLGATIKARFFVLIAQALIEKKELVRAKEALESGLSILEKTDPGLSQITAVLAIADLMASVDANRGFEIMKSVIDAVNHIQITGNVVASIANKFDSKQGFFVLGKTDFDRALLLSQSIEQKESFVTAQVTVCRGLLAKNPTAR